MSEEEPMPRQSGGEPDRTPAAERPGAESYRLADLAHPSTVRFAPRYRRFVLAGALLGALLALVVVLVSEGSALLFWLLLVIFAVVLGSVGAALALVLDRRSLRRRQQLQRGVGR